MKMMIGAFALALAAPALAQTAPAGTHENHARHQGTDHSQHGTAKHDCKECCEKMKGKDGKMECMEPKGESKTAPAAGQDQGHSDHAH